MNKRLIGYLRKKIKFFFDTITNDKIRSSILEAIPFWIAATLTGLIAVAYTKIFNISEGFMHQALSWHSWLIFILAPVNFLLAWYTVRLFAPNAKGSGIPQIMAAIDLSSPNHEKSISKLLSLRIILTKIVSSSFMVMGGGAVGREGPTIQVAGSIFRLVHKYIPASWPKISQKSYLLTGSAAGLAAAFNTPLGGIVFAIEELAKIHITLFRTALFSSVIIAGLVAQGLLGPYLYLGYPDVQHLKPIIFLPVIGAAVISGIAGSIMCRIILKLMRWTKSFSTPEIIMYIITAGLIVAAVAYFVDYNMLGSGKDLMNQTLFTSEKHIRWYTAPLRILGPVLSFTTGGAGGVFAPSLAAGASIGGLLSGLIGVVGANANILILSGMVGFLTGVTRTPFTSAILVLEMTDRHNVIFHLMLAALISNIAALLIDKHSLYEQLKGAYITDVKEDKS